MCGIAGAIDLTGSREFPLRCLTAMTDAIAHRGPDDEYFHLESGVAFGVRRLAIRDVENGRQPIANENNTIWAAFNGQMFNYSELRETLVKREHHLKTHCDTELWVHLYEDFHEGIFERVQGQFAVSLWDSLHRTLLLGRDRMGICPLYYALRDGWLLWASEIKALLASGLVEAKPDVKGVNHLFNFFCAGSHRTYFEDVKLLQPGHFLKIKDGHIETHQYWDLDFPNAGEERKLKNPSPLIEELDSLLNNAVRKRLQADVPVVSYLSSGVDSSLILDITRRQQHVTAPSFTIGLSNKSGPDERQHAFQSAEMMGSKLTTVPLDSSQIANSFPELIIAAEGPILDTSCAALMQLASAVNQQGYKVVLTGEGADEALAGYFWFKTQKISGKVKGLVGSAPSQLLRYLLQASIHRGHSENIPEYAVNGVRPAQQYMYELVGLARQTLYSKDMWASLMGHNAYDELGILNDRIKYWHPLNQSLYVGYKVMLAGLLMISKGDRIAMSSSVEARYPYLDESVIEFCASIDPSFKLKGMTEKWILRQVAAKTLPKSIAMRPKTMFRANLSKIFFASNRPIWVDQLLSPESLSKTGYFDVKAVLRERWLLETFPKVLPRQFIFDAALTCVVSTQLWHHLFCGGGLCELPVWSPT